MFGLMFGDLGHGVIYLTFGLILTLFPNKPSFSALKPFRYFILFLGLCATFCGIIYNEFFSLKTNFFGSCYDINNLSCINKLSAAKSNKHEDIECPQNLLSYRRINTDCVSPLGLDPGIAISGNLLDIMNRFKMKISIFYYFGHNK